MKEDTPVQFVVLRRRVLTVATICELVRATLAALVKLTVIGGCTHLVFWRGESGWLYLPALFLALILAKMVR